ncbi:hypothetical protein [Allostreptomyces psammosilenae]|uniref:Cellulose synthase n=1 Tax=Allostreptomyces psammosilenae TaxID=1892865 RepID=A0A852ZRI2_9ACTN|nr:hypothetical protein [Allostreptomyces psammosilenae]NYI04087.1 hypothetical protein [Allostreptomyces psammosilenae]
MLAEAVCVALTAAGLAIAVLTAVRRRWVRAARIAAVSLLPVGLYLTGLLTLAGRIGSAVGDWAAGLVVDPAVWTGAGVLAVAVLLWVAGSLGARRSRRRAGAAPAGGAGRAVPSAASDSARAGLGPAARQGRGAPADGTGAAGAGAAGRGGGKSADDDLSDFAEIEEILRRRGI